MITNNHRRDIFQTYASPGYHQELLEIIIWVYEVPKILVKTQTRLVCVLLEAQQGPQMAHEWHPDGPK